MYDFTTNRHCKCSQRTAQTPVPWPESVGSQAGLEREWPGPQRLPCLRTQAYDDAVRFAFESNVYLSSERCCYGSCSAFLRDVVSGQFATGAETGD